MAAGRVKSILATDFSGLCVLATAALGLGLAINQLRDKPIPLVYESKELRMEKAVARISSEPSAAAAAEHITLPEAITVEQLQHFLTEKHGLLLDARPEIHHRFGHIPGAISFPREDFENAYKSRQADLEKDRAQPLILYCSSASCDEASLVQKSLRALGYTNVAIFTGGWWEWQNNGLPTETNG